MTPNPIVEKLLQDAIESLNRNPNIHLPPNTKPAKINVNTAAPAVFVPNQQPTPMSSVQRFSMYCLNVIEVCVSQLETQKASKSRSAIKKNQKRLLKREIDTRIAILGCEVPVLHQSSYRRHQRVCTQLRKVMEEAINKNPENITHIDYCLYLAEIIWERTSKKRKDVRQQLKWLIQGLETMYCHLLNEIDPDLHHLEFEINKTAAYYGQKLERVFDGNY